MTDSPERALSEASAHDSTQMEPDHSADVEMADIDNTFDQGEPSIDQQAFEAAFAEDNLLDLGDFDPMFEEYAAAIGGDEAFDQGDSSLVKPEFEPALSEANADDTAEFEPITPLNASPAESVRSLNLGESSLENSRSEKALPEGNAHDDTQATPNGSEAVSPVETAHNTTEAQASTSGAVSPVESIHDPTEAQVSTSGAVSPVESTHDDTEAAANRSMDVSPFESTHDDTQALPSSSEDVSPIDNTHDTAEAQPSTSEDVPAIESVRSLNLGESLLGKPKAALNLGQSSLTTPAGLTALQKAKAVQESLANRLRQKNAAASVVNVPSGVFSPPNADGSTASVPSDIFTPPSFSESAAHFDAERIEFEKLKAAFLLKKQAGTNDLESDVTFLKAEAKEMARQRKAQTDEQHEREPSADSDDDGEGLFVTPGMSPASHLPASETYSESSATSGFFTPTTKSKGRKRKADDGSMAPPSKKVSKTSKKPVGRPKGSGKGPKEGRGKGGKGLSSQDIENTMSHLTAVQRGGKQAASQKIKKSGPGPSHNISNFNSLIHGTDVFRDTRAVAGLSNQPAFGTGITKRDMALRGLIASVPQDDRKAASGDKKFLENSLRDFDGQGSCKPSLDGDGWQLKGMKCTLKHYQVLGVAFMRKRENEETSPRGGILADEMGLGKTVQMIANIINGKPKLGQPRTTLIVASPALISQWHSEIDLFAKTRREDRNHGLQRVIQHRAGYRLGGTDNQIKEAIMDSDICLTTYTEVMKSYPKAEVPPEITTERGKAEWWVAHFEENKGVFHDMRFLRVVLDEAQAIKNHASHSSMSCRALKSEYYWAISGTPLVNGIPEMYPYLKFLRHPHAGSMRTFQANFCSPNDPTGSEKLGVFLRQIMIRRTHKDLLFGARLLDLPTPKQNVMFLEFNAVERTVYEIVKQRFIQRINTITRTAGVNQYSHIWTMLLRLRQICSHVLLIQQTIVDLLEREDFEKLEEITSETEGHNKEDEEVLVHLSHMLVAARATGRANAAPDRSELGVDVNVVPGGFNNSGGAVPNLGNKHGKSYPFKKYLDSAAQSDEMKVVVARQQCCSCRTMPNDAQITSCHHIYCKPCIRRLQHAAARTAHSGARCSECGIQFQSVKDLPDLSSMQPDDTGTSSSGGSQNDKKKDVLDWIGQPGQILPSAKTVAAKAQILDWFDEDPNCKIIVYTQFLPMIRIMGKVCQSEGWGHLKYAGNMSHTAREKALRDFATDASKRVLLMSLKCGGLGLNIVAASRVLLMDPWWNDAVEQQAFCRVFRIGQTSETRLTRLCIKNSIDAAMFAVKERKTAEIDKVMDNSNEPKSIADLLRLFGTVAEDENGNPYIFPDNEGDEYANGVPLYYEPEETDQLFRRRQPAVHMGNDR